MKETAPPPGGTMADEHPEPESDFRIVSELELPSRRFYPCGERA